MEEEDELLAVGVALVGGQVVGEDTLEEGAEEQEQAAEGWAEADAL